MSDPGNPKNGDQNETAADALRDVIDKARATPERPLEVDVAADQAAHERVELDRIKQFIALRGNWSTWLTVWISCLLAFHIGLTVAIGREWLSFKGHPEFLPMVVAQNFAQIVGMGYIIIKFLYPSGRSEPDTAILSPRRRK